MGMWETGSTFRILLLHRFENQLQIKREKQTFFFYIYFSPFRFFLVLFFFSFSLFSFSFFFFLLSLFLLFFFLFFFWADLLWWPMLSFCFCSFASFFFLQFFPLTLFLHLFYFSSPGPKTRRVSLSLFFLVLLSSIG